MQVKIIPSINIMNVRIYFKMLSIITHTMQSFLISALDGDEWSASPTCHFTRGETALRGCVDLRVGLHAGK
jgi:hypothetical protein